MATLAAMEPLLAVTAVGNSYLEFAKYAPPKLGYVILHNFRHERRDRSQRSRHLQTH